jgi:hypothetical protein
VKDVCERCVKDVCERCVGGDVWAGCLSGMRVRDVCVRDVWAGMCGQDV